MVTTLTSLGEKYVPSSWEKVNCPICNSSQSYALEEFGPDHMYTYVRCTNCHLAYLNPRPLYNESFIQTAYSLYLVDMKDILDGEKLTKQGVFLYKKFNAKLDYIEQFTKKGNLLEIGCARGLFCKVAKDKGWKVVGVDVSKTMVGLAQKYFGLDIRLGHWIDVIEPKNQFNAIYCSHVIEHIPDPNVWMEHFRSILAPGGILYIEIPNMESPDKKIKRFFKRIGLRKDHWEHWRTPDHLYEPCQKSFDQLVKKYDYKIIDVVTYSSRSEPTNIFEKLYYHRYKLGTKLRYVLQKV